MLEGFEKFDIATYSSLLTCLYLVVCLQVIFLSVLLYRQKDLSKKKASKLALKGIWSCLELLVDQEKHVSKSWPDRLLWLSTCISIFATVFGILLNLIQVEMVALVQPPELHGIQDILTGDFRNYTPHMLKVLYSYPTAKQAPKHSQLGQLYQRLIESHKTKHLMPGLIELSVNRIQELQQLVNAAGNAHTETTIVEREIVKMVWLSIACLVMPSWKEDMYMSRESFANGVVATFFNRKIDPELRRYFDYRVRTTFSELDHFQVTLKELLAVALADMPWKHVSFHCEANIKEMEMTAFVTFPLRGLTYTSMVFAYGVVISGFVLCNELFYVIGARKSRKGKAKKRKIQALRNQLAAKRCIRVAKDNNLQATAWFDWFHSIHTEFNKLLVWLDTITIFVTI